MSIGFLYTPFKMPEIEKNLKINKNKIRIKIKFKIDIKQSNIYVYKLWSELCPIWRFN